MNRLPAFFLACMVLALSGQSVAAERPLDAYRKIFGPPVQTLKRAFNGDRGAAPAAPAKAAAPSTEKAIPAAKPVEKAAETEEPAAEAKPETAGIPNPRLRPDAPAEIADAPAAPAGPAAIEAPAAPEEAIAAVADPEPRPDADADVPVAPPPPAEARMAIVPEVERVANLPPLVDFDARFKADPGPLKQPLIDIPTPRVRSDAAVPTPAMKLAALPPARASDDAAALDCARSLVSLGVVSVTVEPIREGKCGIATPVAVSALGGGNVSLSAKAMLSCRAAQHLGAWMRDEVQPAARDRLGGSVTGIRVAASYDCRGRNGNPSAKLSEHSYGSAIDISAFQVAGVGWVEVGGPKGLSARRFLSDIREAACGPFTTVLGPGSDAHHGDHFHLDVIRRGKNGNSLYCK